MAKIKLFSKDSVTIRYVSHTDETRPRGRQFQVVSRQK